MRMRIQGVPAVIILAYAIPTGAAERSPTAEGENPHFWRPRIKSVAVFKNGMGFFMREADVELRDGWAVAKEIPPAKFGTLAIYSLEKDGLVDVVGSGPGEVVEFDGLDAPREADAKRSRLTDALKLEVELAYAFQDGHRTAAGKLIDVGGQFAILESSSNSFAVPIEDITRMQVLAMPLRIHVADQDETKDDRQQHKLGMAYLREGIAWIPEYSLRVLDETTAELTLRGTLVNEAEDLVHCDVNFVVGVPHFAHVEYMAPIAVGQVIRAVGAAVAPPQVRQQIMSRAALANNAMRADQFVEQSSPMPPPTPDHQSDLAATLGNLPKLDGPGGSDYTVYTKHDLTVRRGERAIVTLFVKKIKYGHIYRWSPPDILKHFLVLQNDTDTAWTTGPCLATSAQRPLSEDLLRYTPKGGRSEVPVTAAINISHQETEAESDRRFKDHSPNNSAYLDLVILSGELRLKNFEPTEAEIVIEIPVPGKPVFASDNGQMASDSTKLQLLERAGTIRWTIKLQPGEAKTLTYRYERYVPSS